MLVCVSGGGGPQSVVLENKAPKEQAESDIPDLSPVYDSAFPLGHLLEFHPGP